MSETELERYLEESQKEIDESMQKIRDISKKYDKKIKEIMHIL